MVRVMVIFMARVWVTVRLWFWVRLWLGLGYG